MVPTTSNPRVLANWRSSVTDASNSTSLTLGNCTAATTARFVFSRISCIMRSVGHDLKPALGVASVRLRVLSDLHLEFTGMSPTALACDLVVLAGDIHQGCAGLHWARRHFPDLPIAYVPGNHEYYGHDWEVLPGQLAQVAGELGIHLLDRGRVVLDGVRILGCTLWTDYDLFGEQRRAQAMAAAARTLFDYRHIRQGGALITPAQTVERHRIDRAWLQAQLDEAPRGRWRQTVVVTHMVPTFRSTAQRFQKQLLSAGFASHLDGLVAMVAVWIHGHTHDSYDYQVEGCRVVCNPRGYEKRTKAFENSTFDEQKIIEV